MIIGKQNEHSTQRLLFALSMENAQKGIKSRST
jgi:hypothetical protein